MDVDNVKKIMEAIAALMEKKFTGYIGVNFSQGDMGKIVKFEEILKKPDESARRWTGARSEFTEN